LKSGAPEAKLWSNWKKAFAPEAKVWPNWEKLFISSVPGGMF
jgi:hypothetical protein